MLNTPLSSTPTPPPRVAPLEVLRALFPVIVPPVMVNAPPPLTWMTGTLLDILPVSVILLPKVSDAPELISKREPTDDSDILYVLALPDEREICTPDATA
jgi:hypothetical protein